MEKDPLWADPPGSGSALSVGAVGGEGKRNRRGGEYQGHGAAQKRVAQSRVAKVRVAEGRVAQNRVARGGRRWLPAEGNVSSGPVFSSVPRFRWLCCPLLEILQSDTISGMVAGGR